MKEKKTVLKLNELKELVDNRYTELCRANTDEEKFKDHEGFAKVGAYTEERYLNFKNTTFSVCPCGYEEARERYYYLNDKPCPICGKTIRGDFYLIEVEELAPGAFGLFVSNVSKKQRNEEDFHISQNYRYAIGYNEKYIVCNYGNTKMSGHLPDIKDCISNIYGIMSREEPKVYLEGDVKKHLDVLEEVFKKKVEEKNSRKKKKSKRQIILEEFEKRAAEITSKAPESYQYVAIKEPGLALLFNEEGTKEVHYNPTEVSEEDLSYYAYRRNDVYITDLETGVKYKVGAREDSSDYFLDTYLDQFNNISGIAYSLHLCFDEYAHKLEAKYSIYKGFFFNEKGEGSLVDSDGRTNNRNYYYGRTIEFVFDKEKFQEQLEKSNQNNYSIKYAFEESINETNGIDYMNLDGAVKLATTFKEFPVAESLKKTGFTFLANEIVRNGDSYAIVKGAKSIYDIIGFKNKEFTKALASINPGYSTIKRLSEIFMLDAKKSSIDDIMWFNNDGLPDRHLAVKTALQIVGSASKLKEYLINVLNYQCIKYPEAITILNDYYRMAEKLHYDLKNKNILFPSSLKKEHDIAVFSYNAIAEELKKEEFYDSVKSYKYLEYAQTKKSGLKIIAPNEPSDIIGEGKSLHHCVASYVSTVQNRATRIMFIRHKENPDESFYTVEINNDDVVIQLRGLQNCRPTAEVKAFVEEWAEKKKLILRY